MMANTHYYDIRFFNEYGILVPRTVPAEAVIRMVAALLSFERGVRSVDYQLKQYKTELEKGITPQQMSGPAKW